MYNLFIQAELGLMFGNKYKYSMVD